MSTTRRGRHPTPLGEILREEFLVPLGLSQKELPEVINRIVNSRTSVTAASRDGP
jgi:plasmid maintenance system antidote protein VapI